VKSSVRMVSSMKISVLSGATMIESKFLTKSKFSVLIENAVIKQKMTYMDAVLDVCDKNAIDPEDVKKFISTPIRDKIEAEAMRLNFLPKGNTLLFE
jgi:hypothetical protein